MCNKWDALLKARSKGDDTRLSILPSDPVVQSMDINTKSTSYVGVAGTRTKEQPKVNFNFRSLVAEPVFNGVNIFIPRKVIKKVNTRFEHTLYSYFIGKRLAFLVVEYYARNNWEDGISLIATFIGKPIMLDSYTSSMCNDSWGRSSFARRLIKVNSETDLVDVVTIGIPSLTGDDFTKETICVEYECRPPRKKKRKHKFMSTNGGQFAGPLVKHNVRYEPKSTRSAPKKGATNVGNASKSTSRLTTTITSSKNDIIITSNSYFSLDDEEKDDKEEVENVYDESANLFPNTKTGGSSSFTIVAGGGSSKIALIFALSTSSLALDTLCPSTIPSLTMKLATTLNRLERSIQIGIYKWIRLCSISQKSAKNQTISTQVQKAEEKSRIRKQFHQNNLALKLSLSRIQKGEYDIWAMKMEHYLGHTEYPIWKVIQKGNGPVQVSTDTNKQINVLPPKTAEEILARERERKTRTTLLMVIHEDHLAKFYKMTDAKEMWEAIKSRFSSTTSSSSTHNVAFVSSESTSSTNKASIAYGVSTSSGHNSQRKGSSSYTDELMYSFFANQSSGPQLDHEDLKQLDEFDLEEMDLKWQTKVECFNCHKTLHFAKECRLKRNQDIRRRDAWNTRNKAIDNGKRPRKQEEPKALVTLDGDGVDWTEEQLSDASIEIQAYDQALKKVEAQLVAHQKNQLCVETLESVPKPVANEPKGVREPKVWSDAPIIEEFESDSDDEHVTIPSEEQEKPSFAFVNTVKHVKTPSFSHLIRDYDFHEKRMAKQDDQQKALKNKGNVNSGCSRNMTGNKAYLVDYQDYNGGPVAFGGSKGNITGKGKIRTGKLDFEDVCFVKELQHFNLFFVSQICDKNIETECLVLSLDFKLPDKNQALLRVPRQNNMYSFNLKNIVPTGSLACLIAKATVDESNKWHRRLGHVNFKNLNKLVKGNLARGKFDGKSDEGFLVGYSLNSKAFRPVRSKNQANKTARPKVANHSAAKNGGEKPKKDTGLKSNEKPVDQEEQAFLEELERLKRQAKKANDEAEALRKESAQGTENLLRQTGAARASSTNTVNTVSTPDAQAAKIIALKAMIRNPEKKCKPSISHHRAWLKSVQRLSIKKRFRKKESVSNQGRKKDKPKPTLDMDTEEPVNEGRLSEKIAQDKGTGEKGGSAKELVSTARPEDSTVRLDIKEEKAKEKEVSIKDIEDSLRPARSILTLKPLPTIDPKDKGKGVLEEPEPAKKMTISDLDAAQIAKGAEVARLVYEEELAELEREKEKIHREEKASKAAIAEMYDEVKAGIKADALFAAKLQQEEIEEYIIKKKGKFLAETIAAQRRFRAAQRSAEIRSRPPTKSQLRNLMMKYLKNMDDAVDKEKVLEEPDSTKVEVKQGGDEESIRKRLERRYPLTKETLERMLALRLIAESESEVVFDLLRFIQKKIDESGSHDGSEKDLKELAIPKQTTLGKDI
uniref:Ribonuclease H-like domain-containing protein n=1 Tax=Tanacetum cinerariifolium TaxID=118510 RepID=A0A6L2LQN4_TANCI|nr:ribonuclease H-like domain-containing protein [Tanacetum cinerariifolium]